jgi:hypothetical protein
MRGLRAWRALPQLIGHMVPSVCVSHCMDPPDRIAVYLLCIELDVYPTVTGAIGTTIVRLVFYSRW